MSFTDRFAVFFLRSVGRLNFKLSRTSKDRSADSSGRRLLPEHPPTRTRPDRKPPVRVLHPIIDRRGLSTTRLGKGFINLLHQGLSRYSECVGESEDHIQGRSPDSLFEPRHIAPLQTTVTGKIRLAPSLAEAPPDNHSGKAGTELVGIVQAFSLQGSPACVAVTIGPENPPLPLTPDDHIAQIAVKFGISRAFLVHGQISAPSSESHISPSSRRRFTVESREIAC